MGIDVELDGISGLLKHTVSGRTELKQLVWACGLLEVGGYAYSYIVGQRVGVEITFGRSVFGYRRIDADGEWVNGEEDEG